MKLERMNVVVVGALNPAIISPDWLVTQGIVPAPSEPPSVSIEVMGGNSIRFELDGLSWTVSNTRLVVESDGARNPGPIAAAVFDKLSHTPVRGVGSNFHFSQDESDPHCPAITLEGVHAEAMKDWGSITSNEHATSVLMNDKTMVTIRVKAQDNRGRVLINFNRPVGTVADLQDALAEFEKDRETAGHMIVKMLGVGA